MKNRLKIAIVAMGMSCLSMVAPMSVYAHVDEAEVIKEDSETEVVPLEEDVETEIPVVDDPEEVSEPMGPLTPDGNMDIVDDYGTTEKAGKQFITVSTKNGNIFYLIIDRDDKGTENVHFLNLVDERDLLSLMDEEEIEELFGDTKEPEVTPTPEPEPEPVEVVEEPAQKKKIPAGPIALLIIAVLGGTGFYVYKKVLQDKKKSANRIDPDLDWEDDDFVEDIPEEDDEEFFDEPDAEDVSAAIESEIGDEE